MRRGERNKAFEFASVISERENKVATIGTFCIRDETNKWIQFRNICVIYVQYWRQRFSKRCIEIPEVNSSLVYYPCSGL